nr:hypothetical protein [uncultured Flavobacterium sp.]
MLKQAAPGNPWAMGSGHEVKMGYDTNTAADAVRLYKAESQWQELQGYYASSLTLGASYAAGELYKTVTKDENWTSGSLHTTEEFTDKEGRILLKRNYIVEAVEGVSRIVTANTYYVYDQYGNLSFVLPPNAAGLVHQTILNNWCYQYRYDKRNRLVEKKLPGKQWEFIIYDNLDRVIATGPAKSPFADLSPAIGWLITKYDALNRVCYTAWMASTTVNSTDRKNLQNARNAELKNISEAKLTDTSDTNINGVTFRYTSSVWPTSGYHLLTVSYYDNYNFPNAPTQSDFVDFEQHPIFYGVSEKPKGMPTGSWIRVLEASTATDAEKGYVMYDKKGRTIKENSQNHMGGYTLRYTKPDFTGKATYTVTKHRRTASDAELTLREDFTYDNQNRPDSHMHKINNNPLQLMSKNEYDQLGRLIRKSVGSGDETGAAALQKVDYSYNIRGWLKSINDIGSLNNTTGDHSDLFAFNIWYNTPIAAQPLFNGNIAETGWRTSSDDKTRRYAYTYDAINRLTNAAYIKEDQMTGSYNESLQYDLMGNIIGLQRNGGLDSDSGAYIQIDDLSYYYDSKNRLESVEDFSTDPQGFRDGSDDPLEFLYDDDGNMTQDLNKGITSITYNHLNLPTRILFGGGNRGKLSIFIPQTAGKCAKQPHTWTAT